MPLKTPLKMPLKIPIPPPIPPTKFYGSQVGGQNVTPHTYTDSPLILLRHDVWSALGLVPYLQYIVRPLQPWRSGKFCELYPCPENLWCIFLHIILVVMQLTFILSIPLWFIFFLPLTTIMCGVGLFWFVNQGICYILNGPEMVYNSDPIYAKATKKHEHEQWIFLNGVAVGRHWLESNINRLALTFGRPVLGVHNKTNGILFDVIQCLIQRNFDYATQDIRACYKVVKEKLYDTQYTKIVFILHSQGGIEGGMVIDWLLQEVPQDLLAKLEIYTFGNAANHFNNPHQHLVSQLAALSNPASLYTTKTTTQVHYHDPIAGVVIGTKEPNMKKSTQRKSAGKAIRYIEHYANTSDFVARWGVLNYLRNKNVAPTASRYMGRVFERLGRGHQFNQHYLDNMFPLQESARKDGGVGHSGFEGAADESAFMNDIVEWGKADKEDKGEREGLEISCATAKGEPLEEDEEVTSITGFSPISPSAMRNGLNGELNKGGGSTNSLDEVNGEGKNTAQFRVKDLSRLWAYRNGRSPQVDEVDVGIARMATL